MSHRRLTSEPPDLPLFEAARAELDRAGPEAAIEDLWRRAALETFASGRIVDPPVEELKRLTVPERAWIGVVPWPAENWRRRMQLMVDTHHLAMARGDQAWLESLSKAWDTNPTAEDRMRLFVQGQIGLGLAPGGSRPFGWTTDEIDDLATSDLSIRYLIPDYPPDRAWIALTFGDFASAIRAIADHEADLLAKEPRAGDPISNAKLRRAIALPGSVLRVEVRALRVLCNRRGQPRESRFT